MLVHENFCFTQEIQEISNDKLNDSEGPVNSTEPITDFEIGAKMKTPVKKSKYTYHSSEPSPVTGSESLDLLEDKKYEHCFRFFLFIQFVNLTFSFCPVF